MIRDDRFRISHRPYALDLTTLTGDHHQRWDGLVYRGVVRALWYRRTGGVTRACIGPLQLWADHLTEPLDTTDPRAILSADLDGRYGGDCQGRWDGERYWGAQKPNVIAEHLAVLRPMLDRFPVIPAGYDGWWRF